MAVRPILKMGTPSLFEKSIAVKNFDTIELHRLIDDMTDTMNAANGAGLAAPQIGVNQRIVIFEVANNPSYPDMQPVPFTVLINPVLTFLSAEIETGWEGCLSVPGMRGAVQRFTQLRYVGVDQFGASIDRAVDGFHARVVQHECDHLDGILYPMRMTDMTQFGYTEVLFPELVGDED